MKTTTQTVRSRTTLHLASCLFFGASLLTVAGCGSSDSAVAGDVLAQPAPAAAPPAPGPAAAPPAAAPPSGATAPPPTAAVPPAAGSFQALVIAQVKAPSDDVEPLALETVPAPGDETSEPIVLGKPG